MCSLMPLIRAARQLSLAVVGHLDPVESPPMQWNVGASTNGRLNSLGTFSSSRATGTPTHANRGCPAGLSNGPAGCGGIHLRRRQLIASRI
jgi:hypothetical protein